MEGEPGCIQPHIVIKNDRIVKNRMIKNDRYGLVGRVIDEMYLVEEVVAEGGYGIVYRAKHLTFRCPVALKCLKISPRASEEERRSQREKFLAEAEIQFRLSSAHEHIVRPLHVGELVVGNDEALPFLILEWLEGESLEERIRRRRLAGNSPLSLLEAMKLLGPAARTLHHCHRFPSDEGELAVIHRDVKPDNLYVTVQQGHEVIKLLDFGVCKVGQADGMSVGSRSQTSAKAAAFSPAYGAPEQWVPESLGQTGPWTDVFGLALCLVEAISGNHAIVGTPQEMMATALCSELRPSPKNRGVLVTDEVEEVFLRALSVDPKGRYQSVREFWMDLRHALSLSQVDIAIELPPMSEPAPVSHSRIKVSTPKLTQRSDLLVMREPTAGGDAFAAERLEFVLEEVS